MTAQEVAHVAEGDYREALHLLQHADADYYALLRDWLNATIKGQVPAQVGDEVFESLVPVRVAVNRPLVPKALDGSQQLALPRLRLPGFWHKRVPHLLCLVEVLQGTALSNCPAPSRR